MRNIIFICLLTIIGAAKADTVAYTAADTMSNDSDRIVALTRALEASRLNEAAMRIEIEQLSSINMADSIRHARMRQHIDSLKRTTAGVAVVVDGDTLFAVYAKQGGLAPAERAAMVADKIHRLGRRFTLEPDSVAVTPSEFEADIVYRDQIIISVTELDALWAGCPRDSLAYATRDIIVSELRHLKAENGLWRIIQRIGLFAAVILALVIIFKFINRGYRYLIRRIARLRHTHLKPLYIQSVELLDVDKQLRLLALLAKALRAVVMLVVVLLTVPLLFSIFPQTEELARRIIGFIWKPIYTICCDVVAYIPNLFTIFVICMVIKYLVRLLRYFATEVAKERLTIAGFFPDWAMPTFYIVRFLLYAFMVAMIYPYLPGSSSGVFQGVSVFVGLIVSLGSSSVIGNLMAGLVITYMRPFKMGDRIEIKDITGDVIEKTPFVTRIRTPKNEVVTMPNSFVMSSQTINYSQSAQQFGLIIHTDVTMGYEVPWRQINRLLIEAALNTPGVVDDPRPFVLQTSLGDHYTVYQLNAYIRDANLLPDVYSDLHERIQDCFNREGLELLSPHYYSRRDGNASTVCKGEYPPA